jgi:hypothetical protein
MLADRDARPGGGTSRRQLHLPFRRRPLAREPMPVRASQTSNPAPAEEARNRPSLLTPRQLCALYPIKPRTLKYWVQHSADRQVSRQGRRRTIPGNGLAPAIVRKGRLIFIDEELFLVWLYGSERPGRL